MLVAGQFLLMMPLVVMFVVIESNHEASMRVRLVLKKKLVKNSLVEKRDAGRGCLRDAAYDGSENC